MARLSMNRRAGRRRRAATRAQACRGRAGGAAGTVEAEGAVAGTGYRSSRTRSCSTAATNTIKTMATSHQRRDDVARPVYARRAGGHFARDDAERGRATSRSAMSARARPCRARPCRERRRPEGTGASASPAAARRRGSKAPKQIAPRHRAAKLKPCWKTPRSWPRSATTSSSTCRSWRATASHSRRSTTRC